MNKNCNLTNNYGYHNRYSKLLYIRFFNGNMKIGIETIKDVYLGLYMDWFG